MLKKKRNKFAALLGTKALKTLALVSVALVLAAAGGYALWMHRTLVVVNGSPISLGEYRRKLSFYMKQEGSIGSDKRFAGAQGKEELGKFKEHILTTLVERQLLVQAAKAQGIQVTEEDVDKKQAETTKGYPSMEGFVQDLKKHGLSLGDFRDQLYSSLLAGRLREPFEKKEITVGEPEVRAYYRTVKQRFTTPPQSQIKHLVAKDEPSAREAYHKILAKSESFDSLIVRYSLDKKNFNGVVGFVALAQLPPALQDAARRLKPKEISAPIKMPYGYEIIQVLQNRPGRVQPYSQVRSLCEQELISAKKDQGYKDWYYQITSTATVQVLSPGSL